MRKFLAFTLLALALACGAVFVSAEQSTPASAALCHGGGCPFD